MFYPITHILVFRTSLLEEGLVSNPVHFTKTEGHLATQPKTSSDILRTRSATQLRIRDILQFRIKTEASWHFENRKSFLSRNFFSDKMSPGRISATPGLFANGRPLMTFRLRANEWSRLLISFLSKMNHSLRPC